MQSTGEEVALKMLRVDTDQARESFMKEGDRFTQLSHKNIVRCLGTQYNTFPYMIVFEYMSNGDLKSYMSGIAERLRLEHQVKLASDVSSGFAYLQSIRFIHRDLAARNVLLSGNFTAKISDFGMARQLFATEYYKQGTSATASSSWVLPLRWMAPESYSDGTWDSKTDVWMFGVLLWEIFSEGELPWRGLADNQVIQNIQRRAKLPQPPDCPNEFYFDIMLSCWRLDPFARIAGADITSLICQFISEYMKEADFANLIWPAAVIKSTDDTSLLGIDLSSDLAMERIAISEVSSDAIVLGELLGQGSFGEVYKGALQTGGGVISVALKTIKGDVTAEMRRKFVDEAKLFAVLQHPNIVKCVGVHLKSEPLMIAIELMQCDLKLYFKRNIMIASAQLLGVVRQISQAMMYLEANKIIHRDLAARNVLVGFDGLKSVKLNDFGLSRTLSTSQYYKKSSNDKIPVKWMAPESLVDRKYSSASDVWSFAVFCWEVYEHGRAPYPSIGVESILTFILRGSRMERPESCPVSLYSLMLKCWVIDIDQRPTFEQIAGTLAGIELAGGGEEEEESRL